MRILKRKCSVFSVQCSVDKQKLTTRRSSLSTGFTLMELMVVIAIIVLLAGIMTPNLANRIDKAKVTKAEADIASIESAIAMYENDTGRYPESINPAAWPMNSIEVLTWRLTGRKPASQGGVIDTDITNDPNWHGPYLKGIEQDPWKQDYVYLKNKCPKPGPTCPQKLNEDVPDNNTGGIGTPPNNLSYYIYSTGRNKKTPAPDNKDDINNWDVNKSWREAN